MGICGGLVCTSVFFCLLWKKIKPQTIKFTISATFRCLGQQCWVRLHCCATTPKVCSWNVCIMANSSSEWFFFNCPREANMWWAVSPLQAGIWCGVSLYNDSGCSREFLWRFAVWKQSVLGMWSHVIPAQERKRQDDRNVRPVKVVLRTRLNKQ